MNNSDGSPNFQEILAMIHSPEGKHETQRKIVLFDERLDLERDKVVLYAKQVRMYFLKLLPPLDKLFIQTLTKDESGEWEKLFELRDAVPDNTEPKKLSPAREFSKEYRRCLEAHMTQEKAIKNALKKREQAEAHNAAFDSFQAKRRDALPASKKAKLLTPGGKNGKSTNKDIGRDTTESR